MQDITINPADLAIIILVKYIKTNFSTTQTLSKTLQEYVAFKVRFDFNNNAPLVYEDIIKYTDEIIQINLSAIQSQIATKSNYPFPAPFTSQANIYPRVMYPTQYTQDDNLTVINKKETR